MSSQEKVVEYFLNNPTATNQQISAQTGVSKSSVQRILTKPEVGDINIPGLDRTISAQIHINTIAARQKGGRNTFKKYEAKKDESGRFIGLAKEESETDKEEIKKSDIISIIICFSRNPYSTIDQIANIFEGKYTSDYIYRCLNDPRVSELFGPLIASSITQQLNNNRYGILRKFESNWGDELFDSAGLSEREKAVLSYRFSDHGIRSAEAAATQFGVSKTAITKTEDAALQKVQNYQESIHRK